MPALLMSFILGGMALWTGVSHLTSINLPPTVDWYVANLFDFTIPYNLMWIFVFLADFFRPAAWIGMGIVLCLVVLMPVALFNFSRKAKPWLIWLVFSAWLVSGTLLANLMWAVAWGDIPVRSG